MTSAVPQISAKRVSEALTLNQRMQRGKVAKNVIITPCSRGTCAETEVSGHGRQGDRALWGIPAGKYIRNGSSIDLICVQSLYRILFVESL